MLIHNTGWVSPRLIPGSPQSLRDLFEGISITCQANSPQRRMGTFQFHKRCQVFIGVPNYPELAAALHKKDSGWFRLTIDPATGKVTEVKVLKSTGIKILDDSAAVAFMQWKAKPHRLDHAILPAQFIGSPEIRVAISSGRRLESQNRIWLKVVSSDGRPGLPRAREVIHCARKKTGHPGVCEKTVRAVSSSKSVVNTLRSEQASGSCD